MSNDKNTLHVIPPMLAKSGHMPASQSEYGFEIKWDGIRVIVYYEQNKIQLLSRNLLDITHQYPEVATFQAPPDIQSLILDGEIIATDDNGRPSFSQLQHRMGLVSPSVITKLAKQIPATLIIFDILSLNGEEFLDQPYTERRKILDRLELTDSSWQIPSFQLGNGDAMLSVCREIGLEGIVAKRLDSPYVPGKRPGTWIKIKNQLRQELVIGGWAPGQGARSGKIGALLVGYYDVDSPRLKYAGAVGTGYSEVMLKKLADLLSPLIKETNPFDELPPKPGAIFVEPKLVAEFEFTEWTPNHTLRHPSFKGLRFDKDPKDIVREPTAK